MVCDGNAWECIRTVGEKAEEWAGKTECMSRKDGQIKGERDRWRTRIGGRRLRGRSSLRMMKEEFGVKTYIGSTLYRRQSDVGSDEDRPAGQFACMRTLSLCCVRSSSGRGRNY